MNTYKYLKESLESIYKFNNNLSEKEFMIWFKNDFKNIKSRKQMIKVLVDSKQKIINNKLKEIFEFIGKSKEFKPMILKIKTFYNNINKMNVNTENELVNKLKQYDKLIKHLDKIIFKFEINDTIDRLEYMKDEISNQKYNNLFDKEIEQISKLIKILKKDNIEEIFAINEEKFNLTTKQIFNNIKIKINNFKNQSENKKETKISKTKILKQNNNDVLIQDNDKIISLEQENNVISYKVAKLPKKDLNKEERNKRVEEIYNYFKNQNKRVIPLESLDNLKIKTAQNLSLDNEECKEVLDYIDKLKQEFIYLFKTTLDPNDERKIIEMLLNAESLVDKKINEYIKDEKVKKLA